MRNRRLGRKLGVTTKHRKAMLRNMATELFRHESIKTTDAKAKELKRVTDKIVTLAKNGAKDGASNGGLSFKRKIFGYLKDKEIARKVFTEIAERYKQRPGGYSRIISLGFRRGDQTPISRIELVTEKYNPSSKKKNPRKPSLPAPPLKKEEKPVETSSVSASAKGETKEKKPEQIEAKDSVVAKETPAGENKQQSGAEERKKDGDTE